MAVAVDVVVVGELNADLVLTGEVTPAFGQAEKLVDDAALTLGSSSAIFACGLARLGLRVVFIGKIGADEFGRFVKQALEVGRQGRDFQGAGDEFGRFVKQALEARDVDTGGVITDPGVKTGLSLILSRGNDRAILTHPGSIAALRYQEINLGLFSQARHLHLGSYFLLNALKPDIPRLFDAAHARGLTISLDTNYDPAETWNGGLDQVLARTNVFLPNEAELCAISGISDLEAGLQALADRGPLVAAKLGPQGAMARYKNKTIRAGSIPVDVVDTTGAGDSFDAGFVYGYLAGWELERTLRLACVCGALSTRAAGGIAAQPTLAEAAARL